MKSVTTLLALFLISLPVLATEPWGNADPKIGKEHHDKACIACHAGLYGGDGSKMYTRDSRLLTTKLGILQRVAICNSQAKAGWSPETEADVAAYLNQQYYKFKE